MTSTDLHRLAELTGLKSDLIDALEFGKERNTIITAEWIEAIDSSNLKTLKDMFSIVDGNYTMVSLAMAIIKNKPIKL